MPRTRSAKTEAPADMAVEFLPLDSLHEDPANARAHGPRNLSAIKASLARFGQQKPIVIDASNVVRAGNGTLAAARELGWATVRCVRTELKGSEATAYAIADNRSAELAEWDQSILAAMLQSLGDDGIDLEELGFTEEELGALIREADGGAGGSGGVEDPGAQIDRGAELQEKWKTERGQLWVIPSKTVPGKEHRLLCGDSTKAEDVARVMGGERAAICFTSPPYNAGKLQHLSSTSRKPGEKYTNGLTDERDASDYLSLLADFTDVALSNAAFVLVNLQCLSGNKIALTEYLYRFRDRFADVAVWSKTTSQPAMQPRVMNSAFEFVFVFSAAQWPTRHVGTAEFRGTISNVVEGAGATANEFAEIHAATFPVYLPTWAIKSFTNCGEIVLDVFVGTGTTIIAAEQTGRLCYGIEIAEKYVAVILERLAGMGLEPRLEAEKSTRRKGSKTAALA